MNSSARSIIALSWRSAAYGIGIVGSRVIVYLMLPFLTRYMSQDDYGAVSVITALYTFLNTLTNAGLPAATFRFYNDNANAQNQRLILGASQFLFFWFAAIPAIGIIAFSEPISIWLLGSARFAVALQLAAGFLIADTMNFFGTIILRIQVRPLMTSVQGMILVSCEMGMAVFFVVFREMGVTGYWLGFLLGEIVGLAFTIWLVRKWIEIRVSWNKIWELMKFGVPLIPTQLSITALRLADRYIVASLAGLASAAVYDVGYKLGTVTALIISPFQAAWLPFAFSIAKKPEAAKVYRDVLSYLTAGCSFLILAAIALRAELLHIVAPASYANASNVVIWVAASQLFMAAYTVLSFGPMLVDRTDRLAWGSVSAAGLNLLLNYLLIPTMGILGAAIATFVGYLVLAILTYWAGQRSFRIPIDWKRLWILLATSIVVALSILAAEQMPGPYWVQILVKGTGLLCFPLMLLLMHFISPAQGRILLGIVKDRIARAPASR